MEKYYKFGVQASAILLSSAFLLACDIDAQKGRQMGDNPGTEFAPQMYDGGAYEGLKQAEKNPYNPGGLNMRMPANGTIARGKIGYLDHSNDHPSQDVMGAGLKSSVPMTPAMLEDGQVLYQRFCAQCHGDQGAGDGLVAPKFKGVANLTAANIKAKPMGHIYQVITYGKGRMMPHNTQLNPTERWKIAMYVKATIQGEGAPADAVDISGAPGETGASTDANTNPVKK